MWIVDARILNQTDNSTNAIFSNRISGGGSIKELEFKNNRIGGCGQFKMKAKRERIAGHSVSNGNIIELYTHNTAVSSDTLTRRYRGEVISTKIDYSKDEIAIKGYGHFFQFKNCLVVKYLETTDVADVVGDIFDAIKANTYCNTTGNISLSSSATIGDIELYFQEASDIIKKLAEIQGDVDYGVDEDGVFYFIDSTTTKRGHFQVGVNIESLAITTRSDELYNDLFIKTRGLVSSGNLIMHEDDDTSIASYKKRSRIVDAPEFSDVADAITYGEQQVTLNKSPITIYEFEPVLSDKTLFPYTGQVSLVDEDGTHIADVTIEGVTYKFDKKGFSQKLSVGDRNALLDPGKLFSDIERKVKLIEAANISASKIKHEAVDEFKQYVYENAWTNGKYNVFVTNFDEDYESTYIDVDETAGVGIGGRINSLIKRAAIKAANPWSGAASIVTTKEIPTGRKLDSVRLYHYKDQYGRCTFDDDSVLQDWWNDIDAAYEEYGGYRIDETNGYLVGNPDVASANRGPLYFSPQDWAQQFITGMGTDRLPWTQNANGGRFMLRIDDLAITNNGESAFQFVFNYQDTDNLCLFSIERKDASYWTCKLEAYQGGIVDDSDSGDIADSYTSFILRASIDGALDKCQVTIFDADMNELDVLIVDMAEETKRYIYIKRLWNSDLDDGHVGLKWFEILPYTGESDRLVFKISRDGGTTWTSETPEYSTAYTYSDVNISAQPDGDNTIILKAELTWPAVVYGFGFACSGD
jgi:hypothetical protein